MKKNKLFLKNKKIVLILIIVLVALFFYKAIKTNSIEGYDYSYIEKGDVSIEIFEAGVVEKGKEIQLSFAASGRIQKINHQEGDLVKKGEILSYLNSDALLINLERAQNQLALVQKTSEKDLASAEINLNNSKKSYEFSVESYLKTIKAFDEKINCLYDSAFSQINNSLIVADSAFDVSNKTSQKHFVGFYTRETIKALNARDSIQESQKLIRSSREKSLTSLKSEDIDESLILIERNLKEIFNNLNVIIDVLEEPFYRDDSLNEINQLISEKNKINQQLSVITSLINNISMARISGELEIKTAESLKNNAESNLKEATNIFQKIDPLTEKNLQSLQLRQAESEVKITERMIEDSVIRAPFDCRIIEIYSNENEIVQAGLPVFSVTHDKPYQIEINVYEGDISKISIGNLTEIELIAFRGKIYNGEIVSIDFSPINIDGVVYYRVVSSITNPPQELMIGMTADVTIVSEKREDVLNVSDAVFERGSSYSKITLIRNGKKEEVPITPGLIGSNRRIEIVSNNINEGDRVINLR